MLNVKPRGNTNKQVIQDAPTSGLNMDDPTTAPSFPQAAQKPFRVDLTSTSLHPTSCRLYGSRGLGLDRA